MRGHLLELLADEEAESSFSLVAVGSLSLSPVWFLPLALWPMFWLDEYRGWPNGDVDAIGAASALAIAVFAYVLAVTRLHAGVRGVTTRLLV
jgi:hypothetical protein